MKLTNLSLLYAFVSTVMGADDSNVVELTEATFKDHIGSTNLVLAEFFAPWCGHCQKLAPEYEEAADSLKDREDISLAKIDCVENRDLCAEHGIQGYPTLYVFEEGELTGKYEGPRKAADIQKFLVKRAEPAVTEVKNAKGFDAWLSKNHKENPIVVLYTGPKKGLDDFTSVAKLKRDRIAFIAAPGAADLKKKFDNSELVILKDNEDAVKLPAGTKLNKESIAEFVHSNELPAFGELGPDTYTLYVQHRTPMFYAFVEDDKSRDLIKRAVTPYLDDLKGKANVVFLNATLYGRHAENVNLRDGQFPAVVVHDMESNKKYVHDQDVDLTEKSIGKFIEQYVAGEIEPLLKSEPIPEVQEEPTFKLVGAQYDEIVLDDDKDVLVEFYAPWCGHCKNLKPTYDELAELYADNDKIVIAQIDHTANDVPDEIQGYPTIKLFPAGNKENPITFTGSRTLEGLSSFLEEEATNKTPKKAKKAKKAAKKDTDDSVKEEL